MFHRRILQALLLVLASLATAPEIALAQTMLDVPGPLGKLVERAKAYDPAYREVIAQAQADQTTERQSFSALLPRISFNAQIQQFDATRTAFNQSVKTRSNPYGYRLILDQALIRPAFWQSYQQGQLISSLTRLQATASEQDLILRVATAYFDVLSARDSLNTLNAQKAAIQAQLDSARQKFEIGMISVTDQQEAQARFDLTQAQTLAAENRFNVAKLALANLVGPEPVNLPKRLDRLSILSPQPNQISPWAEQAASSNMQVQQAKVQVEIARREVKKRRSGHLPTLDFQAEYLNGEQQVFDNSTGRPFDAEQESTSVGLLLSVPLYSGGLTQSEVEQGKQLLIKAQATEDRARQSARLQAQSAFLSIQTGLSQIQALETAVQSSRLALRANETGYEVGVRINIDVLNAQQQLSQARLELLQAQYDTLLNVLKLRAAVGELSEKSLAELDVLLIQTPVPESSPAS